MSWSFQTLLSLIMINGGMFYNKPTRGYYSSSYKHEENTRHLPVKHIYIHSWMSPLQFPTSPVTDPRLMDEYLHRSQYNRIKPFLHQKVDSSVRPWYDPYTHSRHYFNKRHTYQGLFRKGVDLSRGSLSAMMFDVRADRDRFVDGIPHQWTPDSANSHTEVRVQQGTTTGTPDSANTHQEARGQQGITTGTIDRRPFVVVIQVDRNTTDVTSQDSVDPVGGDIGVIPRTGQHHPRVGGVQTPQVFVTGDKTGRALPPDISDPKPTDYGSVITEGLSIPVALFNAMLGHDPTDHRLLWVPIETLLEDRGSSGRVAGTMVHTNNGAGIDPLSDLSDGPNTPHTNTGQSVENPFLELMEEMGAFGPGPYYKCHPPSRVVCRANTNWYHVVGIEAWCQQNCAVENYSSYCDENRCTCLCVDT